MSKKRLTLVSLNQLSTPVVSLLCHVLNFLSSALLWNCCLVFEGRPGLTAPAAVQSPCTEGPLLSTTCTQDNSVVHSIPKNKVAQFSLEIL